MFYISMQLQDLYRFPMLIMQSNSADQEPFSRSWAHTKQIHLPHYCWTACLHI